MIRILPLLAFLAFAAVPIAIGNAGSAKEEKAAGSQPTIVVDEKPVAKKKTNDQCLASEEVVQDLDNREQKLKAREAALREREARKLVEQENEQLRREIEALRQRSQAK